VSPVTHYDPLLYLRYDYSRGHPKY